MKLHTDTDTATATYTLAVRVGYPLRSFVANYSMRFAADNDQMISACRCRRRRRRRRT